MTSASNTNLLSLSPPTLFRIGTYLPPSSYWALRATCLALSAIEDAGYWKQLITRLGIQPPQDFAKCKLAVANFFHRFNDQKTAAGVTSNALMAQRQARLTASTEEVVIADLREEVPRNKVLDFFLHENSLNLDTFLHITQLYPITQNQRIAVLAVATNKHRLDIIQKLGPLSEHERGVVVSRAAGNGFLGIIQAMLETGPITQEYRGNAVGHASTQGSIEVVQALLKNGPITEEDQRIAIEHAALLVRHHDYHRAKEKSQNYQAIVDLLKQIPDNTPP